MGLLELAGEVVECLFLLDRVEGGGMAQLVELGLEGGELGHGGPAGVGG